jgi:JmjC domain, hydroxylase
MIDMYILLNLRLGIPPADLPRFVRDMTDLEARVLDTDEATKGRQPCQRVLSHADVVLDPDWFVDNGYTRVTLAVQYPGEYILTHPRGAHSVYRLGFSMNEATSVGSPGWVPFGVTTLECNAR